MRASDLTRRFQPQVGQVVQDMTGQRFLVKSVTIRYVRAVRVGSKELVLLYKNALYPVLEDVAKQEKEEEF